MNTQSIIYYAQLANFWNNRYFLLVRLFLILVLFLEIGISLAENVLPSFFVAFVSTLLIIECFFYFCIESIEPQVNGLTLSAARVFVSSSTVSELIKKLLKKKEVQFFLDKAGIKVSEIRVPQEINLDALFQKAQEIAKKEGDQYIFSLYLFIAFLLLSESSTKLLFNKKLKEDDVFAIAHWARHAFGNYEIRKVPKVSTWGRGIGDSWVSVWGLETKKYTVDLTSEVSNNPPPALLGRRNELKMLIEAFEKSEKKNILLVGPPGVGKTTLVRFFAYQSYLGNLPSRLSHKRVLRLLVGSLLAGAGAAGELEGRMKDLFEELSYAQDLVLYIPEFENAIGAGGLKFDMSGILVETLTNKSMYVVGTLTPENYKAYVENLTSFAEMFEVINLEEPTPYEAIQMLEEKVYSLEHKHKVAFTYKSVFSAVELAEKYVPYRVLPGKGIDLLDEAGAIVSLSGRKIVDKKDIVSLIESKSHIRISEPTKKEADTLLHLEDLLHKRVVNQKTAIGTVSEAVRRLRAGLSSQHRPFGTFLFLGPTGVGKTETGKALAFVYFGSDEAMIRLDMSEYQHEDSIAKLIGQPGIGDGRGQLTEAVIQRPFALVLLDEFEKAHPKILDSFLQVFEDGRLTDGRGRTVSFANTIIIATSNAGSEIIRERILAQGQSPIPSDMSKETVEEKRRLDLRSLIPELIDKLQKEALFKPELINRFDAVVVFEPLGEKEIQEIVKIMLQVLASQLKEKDVTLVFDEKVIAKIARDGFNLEYGARPIRRFIQDNIENMLSKKMLSKEINRGNKVLFSTDNADNITLSVG